MTVVVTTDDWRETHSAHSDELEDVTVEELRVVVEERISEVEEAARYLSDRVFVELESARADEWDKAEKAILCHVLANLNGAKLHLEDFTGC